MKKTTRRLTLNRQTVAQLDLARPNVQGGAETNGICTFDCPSGPYHFCDWSAWISCQG